MRYSGYNGIRIRKNGIGNFKRHDYWKIFRIVYNINPQILNALFSEQQKWNQNIWDVTSWISGIQMRLKNLSSDKKSQEILSKNEY